MLYAVSGTIQRREYKIWAITLLDTELEFQAIKAV